MEHLTDALSRVIDMLYFDYIFATILIIWLLIKYVLPNHLKEDKMALFSIGITICVGVGFYFLGDYKIVNLILSGLTVVTFYDWFIKRIFKMFGIEYKASDPELIKDKKDDNPYIPLKDYKKK